MNIANQRQVPEKQEALCELHNRKFLAVDFDLSDKAEIQFFCGECLVEKINSNKLIPLEQLKERAQQIKLMQQDNKIKENQARLKYFTKLLDQLVNFKQSFDDIFETIQKQIQQYILPIQQEKLILQDYDLQLNYVEDVRQLSELYFQVQQKSIKFQEDNNFIFEISRKFELLFNCSEYSQTLQSFKNAKETINDFMENNSIDFFQLTKDKKDQSKTPSLSRICSNHKKEIIMIDMDSQSKEIDDRFVCVDCISENPQIKYQTIENVDKQWKKYNTQSEQSIIEIQKERKKTNSKMLHQIALVRKNYNKTLNEISDKLIAEQFLSSEKLIESNQIKKISIQELNDEQLLKDLRQLIENNNDKVAQNYTISMAKNKDSIFKKEIEYHLEALKYNYQNDIQQLLDILLQNSKESHLIIQLSGMIKQMQKAQKQEESQKNQINLIKQLQELAHEAQLYQCQTNIFEQTVNRYQSHKKKLELIQQNISLKSKDQSEQSQIFRSLYLNITNILNEYQANFENNFIDLKKYSNTKYLEEEIRKLTENKRNLEAEKNYGINSIIKSSELKLDDFNRKLELKEKEQQNMKQLFDQAIQDNIKLKKYYEQEKMKMIKNFQDEQNKLKQEVNENINSKNSELQELLRKIDQINQDKLGQDKQNKIELENIHLYHQSLLFSSNYKHGSCQISEGAKVVRELSNDGWFFCLFEQAIPKTGKIQFAFQMINRSNFMVGVGVRKIMKKNNYTNCHYTGAYLQQNNGHTYSHHNEDVHGKQLSFHFAINDIIIIEVCIEHKYIKWSKLNNPWLTFVMDIDTSQELYPCVGIGWQSSIKILDNVPV